MLHLAHALAPFWLPSMLFAADIPPLCDAVGDALRCEVAGVIYDLSPPAGCVDHDAFTTCTVGEQVYRCPKLGGQCHVRPSE